MQSDNVKAAMNRVAQETLDYYKNGDRFAVDYTGCRYLTDDGAKCAIGRIVPEHLLPIMRYYMISFSREWKSRDSLMVISPEGKDAFEEAYHYLMDIVPNEFFWIQLQAAHDNAGSANQGKLIKFFEGMHSLERSFNLELDFGNFGN